LFDLNFRCSESSVLVDLEYDMTTALFVNHRGQRCGVYQFGHRLFNDVLRLNKAISWDYVEAAGLDELNERIRSAKPAFVLVNYHPQTLGFIAGMKRFSIVPVFVIQHEIDQDVADQIDLPFADFVFCADPDLVPRNPFVVPVPRFIPALLGDLPNPPAIFTVGSFGFATQGKGFDDLCALVNEQFDDARIRINIPPHDSTASVPEGDSERIALQCRRAITKPGIALEITHDFFDDAKLLRFLSENTINAFLYSSSKGRGISSTIDYALASGRPLAVSGSAMFRNVLALNPSPCVDQRSLRDIVASGSRVLAPLVKQYSAEASGKAWEAACLQCLEKIKAEKATPDGRGLNKILDERSRVGYRESLTDLERYAPEMLARKIPRANIQQAFSLHTAEQMLTRFEKPRILAVGSYEDTTVATLRAKGWRIDEVDPVVDGKDLRDFYFRPQTRWSSYDVVLSVSVLEHVENDVEFVSMVADLLAPGGVAILTVDFQELYKPGMPKPTVDHRLYSHDYICRVLMPAIPDCGLVDRPIWRDGAEDFDFEGCRYGFGSVVFRKITRSGTDSIWLKDLMARPAAAPPQVEVQENFDARDRKLLAKIAKFNSPEGLFAMRSVLPLARVIRSLAVKLKLHSRPSSPSKAADAGIEDSKSILVRHFKRPDA
jgi:SAM-dependent methyltransferase